MALALLASLAAARAWAIPPLVTSTTTCLSCHAATAAAALSFLDVNGTAAPNPAAVTVTAGGSFTFVYRSTGLYTTATYPDTGGAVITPNTTSWWVYQGPTWTDNGETGSTPWTAPNTLFYRTDYPAADSAFEGGIQGLTINNGSATTAPLDMNRLASNEVMSASVSVSASLAPGAYSLTVAAMGNNGNPVSCSAPFSVYVVTPANTPTASVTPTLTPSPTKSDTLSPTGSPSASPSATVTRSATPSATASPTPSDTGTATLTLTTTDSPTASDTPSTTRSFTPSPSPTASRSATPSGTASSTPSSTDTATLTLTTTDSPTASDTPSTTHTFTPGPSPTLSCTATPSASASPTPSSTDTVTLTLTTTDSPTASDTPSTTHSFTPGPSPTLSCTATPSASASPTPSSTGTATLTLTTTDSPTASDTPSTTHSFTPSPSPTASPTAPPLSSPSPTLTASPVPSENGGQGTVTSVLGVPNPDPAGLAVDVSGGSDSVSVLIFNTDQVLLLEFSASLSRGWTAVPLPAAWNRLPNGLYFAQIRDSLGPAHAIAKLVLLR